MIEAIFQQAPFDNKNDIERIEAITKEVEKRLRKMPGLRYGECSRCGWHGPCLANVFDWRVICVKCLTKDEIERRFEEAK